MFSRMMILAALGLILASAKPAFSASLEQGKPAIKSIDVIAFQPGGFLLIGDGAAGQVVLVKTPESTGKKWTASIDNLKEKIADRLGVAVKDAEILHFTVDSSAATAYLAVRRLDTKSQHILTIDGQGKISEFSLDNVAYKTIPLPKGSKGAISKITDLAWTGDRLLVSGLANEEFGCKLFCIYQPLEKSSEVILTSAETYHVAHGKWETKAPMTVLMPYEENGKKYLVGAFSCTPLVKYPLESFQKDAKVKGQSVVELGSGNKPLHMFTYSRGDKSYVLINTFRFHHARKPFGPSPYWTARIDTSAIAEKDNINEKALRRLDAKGEPAGDQIKIITEFHGVQHMEKLDAANALVIQEDGKGVLTLKTLALP
ncbi:MAG: hypothetical protein EXR99_14445 [Gemmataceae bacterium]|nr:hypothetical protein [Gemmataceae bacterium]